MKSSKVRDLDVYSFVDPAGGKSQTLKKVRARSAVVTIGVDEVNRVFVLDTWAERTSTELVIKKIFDVYQDWRPSAIGIEANAMQALFADAVIYASTLKNLRIPVVPVVQPTRVTKEFRIRTALQPVISSGRLFIPESCGLLRAELGVFPTGDTVDLVDALASAVNMAPKKMPKAEAVREERQLRDYLLSRGVNPNMVDTRIQSIMAGEHHG